MRGIVANIIIEKVEKIVDNRRVEVYEARLEGGIWTGSSVFRDITTRSRGARSRRHRPVGAKIYYLRSS